MTLNEYENLLTRGSLQEYYFSILRDMCWHCRDCAGKQIGSTQIAGGGGIQGLQRGTKTRPGIITEKNVNSVLSATKPQHGIDGLANLRNLVLHLDYPKNSRGKFWNIMTIPIQSKIGGDSLTS